ncbi:MAG: sec-independent protein translocase protein TatC [Gaiellaceae bacterium]|nr:sec-independent protein translocase protein TatC [Gaiellaceae bacterium]
MARALRPIGHEDRLTLVDHLDELRKRLVISIVGLVIAFSFCFWQNNAILDIVTKPVRDTQNLKSPSKTSKDPLEQAARFSKENGQALRALAPALSQTGKALVELSGADNVTAAQRGQLDRATTALAVASREAAQAAQALPRNTQRNLVTLGVTEPFTTTVTTAFYAALLLAMPLLLYQAYAFILPAFSPRERKVAVPLMLMVPVLFVAGVLFGYFVVLERAIQFLQNFNDDSFDILLQAKEYIKFALFFLAGIGVLFQIPVGVLAVTRLGILTPKQLAANRGYVILGIAIVAAVATPTPDPVTMTLAMAPLIVLFELSILLARWIDRIKPVEEDDEDDDEPDDDFEDDDLDGDDGPGGELATDDDDDLDDDEPGPPDLAAAAEAVQQASESDSPKLEGQDPSDPNSKD